MASVKKTIGFPKTLAKAIEAEAHERDRDFSYIVREKLGSLFSPGVHDTRGVAEKKSGYKTKGNKRTVPPYTTRKAA